MFSRQILQNFLWITLSNILIGKLSGDIDVLDTESSRPPLGHHRALDEFTHHEVVVPKLYHGNNQVTTTLTKTGHLPHPILVLSAFNQVFVVDLHLNRRLFAPVFIEKFYSSSGEEIIHHYSNHTDTHCFYHGHLANHPGSISAFSSCQGIRGTIFTEDDTYHIEPYQSVINGKHLIFRNSDRVPRNITCGHGQGVDSVWDFSRQFKRPTRLKRSVHEPYDSTAKTKVVELYVVNDHAEYIANSYDVGKVTLRTKEIINIVSSLYRPLNIYVALVGVEVWSQEDKIEIVENPDKTMNNFLEYRRQQISPNHRNDNAQLITGATLGAGVVGKAPIMTICSWQYSGGVNMDHSSVVGPVATTVAHELGHNFGLAHDGEACACPDDRCIMAPSSGGIRNPTKWSACSRQQFDDSFHQGMDYCLHNLPKQLYEGPVCGNGFLEQLEECDCGLPEDCSTACCNATTCRLTVNATCATGSCCDQKTCQPKPITTLCHAAVSKCDLPEFCNGESEFCPHNIHVRDGIPCTDGMSDSYCYGGKCSTHGGQCRLLWGRTGKISNRLCYEHFNTMGLANGHCGFNWVDKLFTKCKPEDVMCGMLHCAHSNEKLMFWLDALAYTMPEAWVMDKGVQQDCKGAILDVGLNMPDPGMVPSGAKCGDQKICVNQKCTALANLEKTKCPDCNGHGVCNSLGQCHCDNGYAPPTCDRSGNGGSLHSGPTQIQTTNVSLVVGLCLLFLLIIPLIILAFIFGYRHKEQLKQILIHGPTEGYRSIYRARPRNDIVKTPEPVALPTVSSNRRPPSEVRRVPSFRPEDIGNPQLDSTTKSLTGIPTLPNRTKQATKRGTAAHAGGHSKQQTSPTSLSPVPSRPAPRRPDDMVVPPSQPAKKQNALLRGLHAISSPSPVTPSAKKPAPERPPPPKVGGQPSSQPSSAIDYRNRPLPTPPSTLPPPPSYSASNELNKPLYLNHSTGSGTPVPTSRPPKPASGPGTAKLRNTPYQNTPPSAEVTDDPSKSRSKASKFVDISLKSPDGPANQQAPSQQPQEMPAASVSAPHSQKIQDRIHKYENSKESPTSASTHVKPKPLVARKPGNPKPGLPAKPADGTTVRIGKQRQDRDSTC